MRLLIIFAFSVFIFSCTKAKQDSWLNAVVEDTNDMNCGTPRISFLEDSVKIRAITGQSRLIFVCKGLPQNLNVQGKRLKVRVENLKAEESFACRTWGPNFPAIKVIDAKDR